MQTHNHRYSTVDDCPTPGCGGTTTFEWLEIRVGSEVLKKKLVSASCDNHCSTRDLEAANKAVEEYAKRHGAN